VGVLRICSEAEIKTLEPDLDNASAGNRSKNLKESSKPFQRAGAVFYFIKILNGVIR
jgi:hypothetical protein